MAAPIRTSTGHLYKFTRLAFRLSKSNAQFSHRSAQFLLTTETRTFSTSNFLLTKKNEGAGGEAEKITEELSTNRLDEDAMLAVKKVAALAGGDSKKVAANILRKILADKGEKSSPEKTTAGDVEPHHQRPLVTDNITPHSSPKRTVQPARDGTESVRASKFDKASNVQKQTDRRERGIVQTGASQGGRDHRSVIVFGVPNPYGRSSFEKLLKGEKYERFGFIHASSGLKWFVNCQTIEDAKSVIYKLEGMKVQDRTLSAELTRKTVLQLIQNEGYFYDHVLVVKNLPDTITVKKMDELFPAAVNISLPRDTSGQLQGFAEVTFKNPEMVQKTLKEGAELEGRSLQLCLKTHGNTVVYITARPHLPKKEDIEAFIAGEQYSDVAIINGYGFINCNSLDAAKRIIMKLDGLALRNITLRAEYGKATKELLAQKGMVVDEVKETEKVIQAVSTRAETDMTRPSEADTEEVMPSRNETDTVMSTTAKVETDIAEPSDVDSETVTPSKSETDEVTSRSAEVETDMAKPAEDDSLEKKPIFRSKAVGADMYITDVHRDQGQGNRERLESEGRQRSKDAPKPVRGKKMKWSDGSNSFDLFVGTPLYIFVDKPGKKKAKRAVTEEVQDDGGYVHEKTLWDVVDQENLDFYRNLPASNAFIEQMQWTRQGKMWNFPIDNEQDWDEEKAVSFQDHIFLEKHIQDFPKKGPIRHFMELVCVGLSKNPYMSAQEKEEHIDWYRQFFKRNEASLRETLGEAGVIGAELEENKGKDVEA